MNRILRTLSTFLVLPLLATVYNAQSNESDRELILKINGSGLGIASEVSFEKKSTENAQF